MWLFGSLQEILPTKAQGSQQRGQLDVEWRERRRSGEEAGREVEGRTRRGKVPATSYSAYAPFGRGAQGRPQFYPPGSRPTWFPSSPGPRPARGFGRGNTAARSPFQ